MKRGQIASFFLLFCVTSIAALAQNDFYSKLSEASLSLTKDRVIYDPSYFSIPYPNGDVPKDRGVCTDVIIRAYRIVGIDLQQKVHEDMKTNFQLYPARWGLTKPDKNIDHRRVPNLMTFFSRHGTSLQITTNATDYTPGDIVTWDLGNGVTHIGMVVNKRSEDNQRFLIVHNIGHGHELSDCLFQFKITGHYRFGNLL
jgi:uncharacterized protein